MSSNGICRFKLLEQVDLPLLKDWPSAADVRQWWGDPESEIAEISGFLDGSSVKPYIVSTLDRPISCIQS